MRIQKERGRDAIINLKLSGVAIERGDLSGLYRGRERRCDKERHRRGRPIDEAQAIVACIGNEQIAQRIHRHARRHEHFRAGCRRAVVRRG